MNNLPSCFGSSFLFGFLPVSDIRQPAPQTGIRVHLRRLRAVSFFSVVRRAKRETRNGHARDWWRETGEARNVTRLGLPPSFRASRGFAAPARVHCCVHCIANLKKKRDYSQSSICDAGLPISTEALFYKKPTQNNRPRLHVHAKDWLFFKRGRTSIVCERACIKTESTRKLSNFNFQLTMNLVPE